MILEEARDHQSGRPIETETGSFRDPDSQVIRLDDRVFRRFSGRGAAEYQAFANSGLLTGLVRDGRLVASESVVLADVPDLADLVSGAHLVIEHPRLPFISYAYEWPFEMLRAAALLHLDILRTSLERGFILKDSSTFNIQFIGSRPVFIDHGSFERRREGEPWRGYAQFCRMFLNPLVMQARTGIEFQGWLRSSLEGIAPADLSRLLPLRHKVNRPVFVHVVLQAWLNNRFASSASASQTTAAQQIGTKQILGMVDGLTRFITDLRPARQQSNWVDYAGHNTYDEEARQQKERFVERAISSSRPRLVWDLGSNTGAYSRIAARHADWVVAMDSDAATVGATFSQLGSDAPNIIPLVMDLLNPSPEQGWGQGERLGLERRGPADFALGLALIHHLTITGNVPFDRFFDWLSRVARRAVVEFVPKDDPMVARLLQWRPDVFDEYYRCSFENAASRCLQVMESAELSNGRVLYHLNALT